MVMTFNSWSRESDDIISDLVDIIDDIKRKKAFIKYNKKACVSIIQKCERLMNPLQNLKNSILRTSQPLRSTLITECSIESVDSLDIGTNNDGGENTGINRLKCLDNIKDVFLNCQNFVTKYGLSEGYFNLDQDMDADEEYHRTFERNNQRIKFATR